jgi:hypothetical protein
MLNRIPLLVVVSVVAVVIGSLSAFFPLIVLGVIGTIIGLIVWAKSTAAAA